MSASKDEHLNLYWIKADFGDWKNYFFLALVLSGAWMIISKSYYWYNYDFANLFGISVFPLVAWTIGLFVAYILFVVYGPRPEKAGFWVKAALFSIFYWFLLIAAETIGYHIFKIQNLANASYTGLPICNCLHAPTWMKIAYFALGPIFFLICTFLNIVQSKSEEKSAANMYA